MLTVAGDNFHPNSTVRWKGNERSTAFLNSSQLTAAIPGNDLLAPGSATIDVRNCPPNTCMGDISNALPFTVTLRNPLPTVTSLSPPGTTGGSNGFLLGVNGSNFVFNSEVKWDGTDRTTTFLNSSQLQAVIPATDLEVLTSAHPVTVVNPARRWPARRTSTSHRGESRAHARVADAQQRDRGRRPHLAPHDSQRHEFALTPSCAGMG
jgi:hypothetical protein